MMTTIETYVRNRQIQLRKLVLRPEFRLGAKIAGFFLTGTLLSSASLAHSPLPLTMSLVLVLNGWRALILALGGGLGYNLFWGQAGLQGIIWLALALPVALIFGKKTIFKESPLLMPSLSALMVALSGLAFQILLMDTTSVPVYLLTS